MALKICVFRFHVLFSPDRQGENYILPLKTSWNVLVRWKLFAVCSSSSSSLSSSSSSVKTEGAGLVVVGLYYSLGRWCCSSHGALKSLPAYLVIIIERWPGFSTERSSTAPAHSGDLASPSTLGASDRAGTQGAASAAVSAPATGRSGAELSTHSALFFWGREPHHRQQNSRDISSSWTL